MIEVGAGCARTCARVRFVLVVTGVVCGLSIACVLVGPLRVGGFLALVVFK